MKDVSMKHGRLLIGVDIGTTKVCAVVGEVSDGTFRVIGVGIAPSKGLRKGVVTDIEHTVGSIRKAVREAERMAGVEIRAAQIGITGGHISSISSNGCETAEITRPSAPCGSNCVIFPCWRAGATSRNRTVWPWR